MVAGQLQEPGDRGLIQIQRINSVPLSLKWNVFFWRLGKG